MITDPVTPAAHPAAPEGLPRLLAAGEDASLRNHVARFGPLRRAPATLITEVERAGLRGHGGAGFPTAVKLAAVAARGRSIVVANGTEGEPASRKDRSLLTYAPHLVLDGALAAAQAVGGREVIVCVDRGATRAQASVERAIAERGGTLEGTPVRVAAAPNRYITGEESALVHWLNGGDAKPTFVPPRPFERGVDNRPTLVQNVETLAHLALIARYGGAWFRTVGTPTDPGSALVTVSGVERPGVYEIALGTGVADVLRSAGAPGTGHSAPGQSVHRRPVLVGGYFGAWLPAASVGSTLLTAESLASAGTALGCGVLAVLPDGVCGLAESARVTRWLAGETAGQCGPCVHGLDAIARAMEALVWGEKSGKAEERLVRWLAMVKGRGACRHPDGAARFVESALRVFRDEIDLHRRRGACTSGPADRVLPTPRPGGWR